ncbi:hypothetical protein [Bradyrhizobium glycinis]|uniref:hypothetical protein n=1 Tax=Bradyrhizobium glycinis TaxID=2751812 RepID=UPI0018D8C83F|nr:hypothetical protein [Bradyrhizobium glycinis]
MTEPAGVPASSAAGLLQLIVTSCRSHICQVGGHLDRFRSANSQKLCVFRISNMLRKRSAKSFRVIRSIWSAHRNARFSGSLIGSLRPAPAGELGFCFVRLVEVRINHVARYLWRRDRIAFALVSWRHRSRLFFALCTIRTVSE